MPAQIDIPMDKVKDFCGRWKVTEFSLFGSVLRDDFCPESDVDVLLVFAENAGWSLWDLIDMKEELEAIFGRPVDIVEKRALRNPFRKHAILSTYKVIYAA